MNNKKSAKYPLVKKGYAILDCPHCGKTCYPDAQRTDGAVIYTMHKCQDTRSSFEIDKNGDLVE